MAKQKKTKQSTRTAEIVLAIRTQAHEQYVDALRDGRRQRASTYPDRRKVANKKACRRSAYS